MIDLNFRCSILLFVFISSFVFAQKSDSAANDHVEKFRLNASELKPELLVGDWNRNDGFTSESILLEANNRFRSHSAGCFGNYGKVKGIWRISELGLIISNGKQEETLHILSVGGEVCLLTRRGHDQFKELSERLDNDTTNLTWLLFDLCFKKGH